MVNWEILVTRVDWIPLSENILIPFNHMKVWRVWRYQRGNQERKSKMDRKQYGEKKNEQKDKQRSTRHYTKN